MRSWNSIVSIFGNGAWSPVQVRNQCAWFNFYFSMPQANVNPSFMDVNAKQSGGNS